MSIYIAQLTAQGTGAIAVLLVAGRGSLELVRRFARLPQDVIAGQSFHRELTDPASGEPLDDSVIVAAVQDQFELHLHGGQAVVEAVTGAFTSHGAVRVSIEQACDLGLLGAGLRGELALALSLARTMTALRLLTAQIDVSENGLNAWIHRWQDRLSNNCSQGQLTAFCAAARLVGHRSRVLTRLLDPPRIAIVGPPNAGKSTLANALLGRPVSITSHIPGTTRDWVDAQAIFATSAPGTTPVEVAVTLIDTAGIRETPDPLEQESIRRTHQQARAADAMVLLLDATRPPTADERQLADRFPGIPVVVALNKIDLSPATGWGSGSDISGAVRISAKLHQGLTALMSLILERLDLHAVVVEPFAFTERQRAILERLENGPGAAECTALLRQLSGEAPSIASTG